MTCVHDMDSAQPAIVIQPRPAAWRAAATLLSPPPEPALTDASFPAAAMLGQKIGKAFALDQDMGALRGLGRRGVARLDGGDDPSVFGQRLTQAAGQTQLLTAKGRQPQMQQFGLLGQEQVCFQRPSPSALVSYSHQCSFKEQQILDIYLHNQ